MEKILYHASHEGIQGDIAPISRVECDFGPGFYMSNRLNQTLGLVLKDKNPRKYSMVLDPGKVYDLKILDLLDREEDWFYLVMYNRGILEDFRGTELYEKYEHMMDGYDIVIGQIADDSLAPAMVGFKEGTLTDIVTLTCIKEINLGTQVVAKTKKGCEAISILTDESVSVRDRKTGENFKRWKNEKSHGIIARMNIAHKGQGSYIGEILTKARNLNKDSQKWKDQKT